MENMDVESGGVKGTQKTDEAACSRCTVENQERTGKTIRDKKVW